MENIDQNSEELMRRFRERAAQAGITDPDLQQALMFTAHGLLFVAGGVLEELTGAEFKKANPRYEAVTKLMVLAKGMAEDITAMFDINDPNVGTFAIAVRADFLARSGMFRTLWRLLHDAHGVVNVTAEAITHRDDDDERVGAKFKL